jgi:hypothetical protein
MMLRLFRHGFVIGQYGVYFPDGFSYF